MCKMNELLETNKCIDFSLEDDGIFRFMIGVCISRDSKIRQLILDQGQKRKFDLHPSTMKKLYHGLLGFGMKRDEIEYVVTCMTC